MEPVSQIVHILADGADHGAANAVTLGTTAAAVAAWNSVKARLSHKEPFLNARERAVLAAEPGQRVDLRVLRELLEMLPRSELTATVTIHGDHITGDKNITVYGDYFGRDAIRNNGVISSGSGSVTVTGSALGQQSTVSGQASPPETPAAPQQTETAP